MITIKSGSYTDTNIITLLDAFEAALNSVPCPDDNPACNNCPNRAVCHDLKETTTHLEKLARSRTNRKPNIKTRLVDE